MEVWLQDACKQFVITWACRCLLVSQAVLVMVTVMAPVLQSHRILHIRDVLVAPV